MGEKGRWRAFNMTKASKVTPEREGKVGLVLSLEIKELARIRYSYHEGA